MKVIWILFKMRDGVLAKLMLLLTKFEGILNVYYLQVMVSRGQWTFRGTGVGNARMPLSDVAAP